MAVKVTVLDPKPAPKISDECGLYSCCREATRELKAPRDPKYAETNKKVQDIWKKSVAMIEKHPIAQAAGGPRNVQVNFSKSYISFEDDNGREHRLNMHTYRDNEDLQNLMQEISHTGKELASLFKRPQNNPEASFAVTSSPAWDAIRPRSHEEFRTKGQERALIKQIEAHPSGANAVQNAQQRIANTDQFMTKLNEKLQEQRERFEQVLKEADNLEPPLPKKHPERLALQKQIENIEQLQTMLASVDEKGTRDAIYWAVGIGGEINDNAPGHDPVGLLATKAAQISQSMEIALKSPLSPEDTRGNIEKRLPINEPPEYMLNSDSVNTPYISSYAQDAGNLVYSDGSIESFIVHCATRMESDGGNNLSGALDALRIPFATNEKGESATKDWMIAAVKETIQEIRNPPPI